MYVAKRFQPPYEESTLFNLLRTERHVADAVISIWCSLHNQVAKRALVDAETECLTALRLVAARQPSDAVASLYKCLHNDDGESKHAWRVLFADASENTFF